MIGQHTGWVVMRHANGFGFIEDETVGSPHKGTTLFFHPKFIDGRKHLYKNARVTFDVVPDDRNADRVMAVNIDVKESV